MEGYIDLDAFAKQVNKVKPKLIVAGASAYPREIDFATMADIAHANGAMFMVDMAHIGLSLPPDTSLISLASKPFTSA